MNYSKFITKITLVCAATLLMSFTEKEESTSVNLNAEKESVKAVAVTDFLNSLGANSSISRRGEKLEETIDNMKYTGLRWIRSGYEDNAPLEDFIKLHNEAGTMFSYGFLSGKSDIDRLIKDGKVLAKHDALLAFEGANEPNNWELTYKGEEGGKNFSWMPIAKLHRDLYATVKKDPELKNYPVWATCETGAETDNVGLQFLEIPEGAGTLMPAGTKYADYANTHNYISHPSWPGLHDNQTWLSCDPGKNCPVDGLYGNFGLTWLKKFPGYTTEELITLPKVTTETGYHVKAEEPAVTEEIQARLYMNLFLSQFKRGWTYTAVYLLKARANEPGHEGFAFFDLENNPRRPAIYLHNFTTILADDKAPAKTGTLDYTIANQPETTHDLLLQHSNGDFMLVLWGERFTSGGADKVTVNLGGKPAKVVAYDPTTGTEPLKQYGKVSTISLSLTDHPVVLKITR